MDTTGFSLVLCGQTHFLVKEKSLVCRLSLSLIFKKKCTGFGLKVGCFKSQWLTSCRVFDGRRNYSFHGIKSQRVAAVSQQVAPTFFWTALLFEIQPNISRLGKKKNRQKAAKRLEVFLQGWICDTTLHAKFLLVPISAHRHRNTHFFVRIKFTWKASRQTERHKRWLLVFFSRQLLHEGNDSSIYTTQATHMPERLACVCSRAITAKCHSETWRPLRHQQWNCFISPAPPPPPPVIIELLFPFCH